MNELGDSVVPIYEFEFADGTVRRTDRIDGDTEFPIAIENLAVVGRDDDECTVNHVGFRS